MTGRPPRIGITCDVFPVRHRRRYTVYDTYVRALREAGAFVVALPPHDPSDAAATMAVLDQVDALVMPGGDDLHPRHWGEGAVHEAVTLSQDERSDAELSLVEAALERGTPLLGICLGFQTINVALGGTIVQHLDPETGHGAGDGTPAEENEHEILVEAGTRLHELLGSDRVRVNSGHHQAVGDLGRGLRIAARSPDGVVEAIEHAGHPFLLGVQWHPEERPRDAVSRALFAGLTAAAGL